MNPADAVLDKDAAGAYRHWRLARDADGIVWLTFDKAGASTNTFSKDVMEELAAIVDRLAAERPKGLVIRSGKGSGFIAGADVEEFAQIESVDEALAIVRRGWETFNRLAALPFPTVALIEGFCMGGGVELALACRYRIAVDVPGTRFALPEVMLGILPGWGGVKRLPGLVGPSAALDMMLTGRSIDARRAKKMGLVDEAVPPRVMENAARTMVREAPAPRTLPFTQKLMNGPLKPLVVAMARAQLRSVQSASTTPRRTRSSSCGRSTAAIRSPRHRGTRRRSSTWSNTRRRRTSSGSSGCRSG
jgi:3-hydroxyacyl-CoA dehydrogenase/enoyl-CoA hydratase/3-hydroxybutyryl-CoA epimerase